MLATMELRGFGEVVVEDEPHMTEYSNHKEWTHKPFAWSPKSLGGRILIKEKLLGWEGSGYAHVALAGPDRIHMPRQTREAAEGFMSRVRWAGHPVPPPNESLAAFHRRNYGEGHSCMLCERG